MRHVYKLVARQVRRHLRGEYGNAGDWQRFCEGTDARLLRAALYARGGTAVDSEDEQNGSAPGCPVGQQQLNLFQSECERPRSLPSRLEAKGPFPVTRRAMVSKALRHLNQPAGEGRWRDR